MTPVLVNSAFVRVPQRVLAPGASWRNVDLRVRYGFFDHPRAGPVLVDTGYGPRVTMGAERSGWLRAYAGVIRPQLQSCGDAVTFVQSRGIQPHQIRNIILTHFHADHVAAVADFPNARFWVDRNEWHLICNRSHFANIRHGVFPELFPADMEERVSFIQDRDCVELPFGLGSGFEIFGDGTVLSVPLPGHSTGHFGLLFPDLSLPMLYAVDTHWLMAAVTARLRPTLAARLAGDDISSFAASIARVQAFQARGGACALCHDPNPSAYDDREQSA